MSEKRFTGEPGMSFEDVPEDKKRFFKKIDESGSFVEKSAIDNPEEAFEDSFNIREAKVVSMEWEPGDAEITHDYSKLGNRGDDSYEGALARGGKEVAGGRGTYVMAFPGHFILKVEVDGLEHEIWTERDFKLALGISRMTKKTRDTISAKLPETIKVEERKGQKGKKYYRVADDDIIKWAKSVEL